MDRRLGVVANCWVGLWEDFRDGEVRWRERENLMRSAWRFACSVTRSEWAEALAAIFVVGVSLSVSVVWL